MIMVGMEEASIVKGSNLVSLFLSKDVKSETAVSHQWMSD
jgi:hypothetical protein